MLFDFTCSFVFMISIYSDINLFKLFPYVSTYFCLLIGGGTQSHQDGGGTPTHGGYQEGMGELKKLRTPFCYFVITSCFLIAHSLICNWPLLKDISFNSKYLLFWCD